jgi:hypothetical protein
MPLPRYYTKGSVRIFCILSVVGFFIWSSLQRGIKLSQKFAGQAVGVYERVDRTPDNFTLGDITMHWSKDVHRLWLDLDLDLDKNLKDRPPAQILLTNIGWNHPDPNVGLKRGRTIRSAKLTEAVVNHRWFHPTAWNDQFENKHNGTATNGTAIDKSIRYYVFMDTETCYESNWPVYGNPPKNNDLAYNRPSLSGPNVWRPCKNMLGCPYFDEVFKAPIFNTPGVKATLVVFDCAGNGQHPHVRNKYTKDKPMAMVSISSGPDQLRYPDMGMPPPAVNPTVLTRTQIDDIATCQAEETRPYLLTFMGNYRHKTRQKMKDLANDKDVLILVRGGLEKHLNGTFEDMLALSKFAAAPRGDNKFSYRLTEVLSGGAIPVIYSDGWVLPFRKELVDWTECALHIPEADVNQTLDILAQIDDKKRCQMRQKCYEIYDKYMRTHDGTIAGIIESLEMVAQNTTGHNRTRRRW